MNLNQRSELEDAPFTYRISEEKVFVFWKGKRVKILKGKEAKRVVGKLEHATPQNAQLIMAKLTGNFKRGNERG